MLVTDPVCGMQIDGATSEAREVVGGRIYYFCGTSCREKFRANPEYYAKKEEKVRG